MRALTCCAAVALLLVGCASQSGASQESAEAASIPFANMGGIYDWAADGDTGLYIESIHMKWYHAKLLGPCLDLPFAQRVGFVTEPGSGTFDQFSSILVRGQECPVVSLTPSAAPPANVKRFRSNQSRTKAAASDAGAAAPADTSVATSGAPPEGARAAPQ